MSDTSKATPWKLEGGGLGARTNFVYEGPDLIGLFYKSLHADRCIQAINSYNPERDKLARGLAEKAVSEYETNIVDGCKCYKGYTCSSHVARQLLKLYGEEK